MGVLGLITVDKLAAVFNPRDEKMTLAARGKVPNITYGFKFTTLALEDGGRLLYELQAYGRDRAPPLRSRTRSRRHLAYRTSLQ